MRKVLFVVSSLDVGGIETYLLNFLCYAGPALDATVLCKSGRGGVLAADYQRAGVKIVLLKIGTSVSHRYVQFYRTMRESNWDAVCDFTGDFAGLVLLTARLASVQTRLAFYRGSQYQFKPTIFRIGFARFLSWLVRMNATGIFSNSQAAFDRFHPGWRHRDSCYRVIRNPSPSPAALTTVGRAELRRMAGIPDDAFVLVHVGRVTPAKNHEVIVAVARTIIERHPNAWVVLIGLGSTDYCKNCLPQHVATRFKTFEHRSDVVSFLQASDVFLFPSLNEGMPNALIEAMAAGCPIVASDIPAIREIFPSAYSSCLFEPTDVQGAVERIENLIVNPDKSYGLRLMDWVRSNFALEATFGIFLNELGVPSCQVRDVD